LEAGKIEGRYLAGTLPQGGNVIYLVGQYGGASTERRKPGFESVLKEHPNLSIVTELQGYGSRDKAKTIMEEILQKFPKSQLQALVAQVTRWRSERRKQSRPPAGSASSRS
jgi:ABC-type sugar transport system substrate-binding protein